MIARVLASTAALSLVLVACGPKDTAVQVPQPVAGDAGSGPISTLAGGSTQSPAQKYTGLSAAEDAALDRSTSPCDDFYQFACGGWIKANPIPDDEAAWMRGFSVLREKNELLLKEILEGFAKGNDAKEPYAKALGDFYASCMDEDGIEKQKLAPLDGVMKSIAKITDKNSLVKVFAELHLRGIGVPFAAGSQQDFGDSTKVVGLVEQNGLGMPDRDYYLAKEGKMVPLREKYVAHVQAMFEAWGEKPDQAKKSAETVLKLETALAEVSMTKEDRRDPKKIYHLKKRAEAIKEFADFPWEAYFKAVGMDKAEELNFAQTEYTKALGEMAAGKVSAAEWKIYLSWHVLHASARALPKRFVDENFRWQSALAGLAKIPPRWKRCVRATDGAMGEALGRAFVKRTLGEGGKAEVKALIEAIEGGMKDDLEQVAWMDNETRAAALKKLGKVANKVAYPDKWRNYDALKVTRGSYAENIARSEAFELRRNLAKIGKPVDRAEWYMSPPTINAYYDPSMNEMVFPAGILQSPFFNKDAPKATNYGGIGLVMGHEVTHGFDDEGRQFDADGNLKDFWTKKSNDEFERRASCVEQQFNGYTVLGDAKVNGKLTLGENIADLGGLKISLRAFQKTAEAKEAPKEGSFTQTQRYFLGFAQGWCGSYRDETMRLLVATNPHSPPSLRVNGPTSNSKEFADAFQCKAGSKMVRAARCEVW